MVLPSRGQKIISAGKDAASAVRRAGAGAQIVDIGLLASKLGLGVQRINLAGLTAKEVKALVKALKKNPAVFRQAGSASGEVLEAAAVRDILSQSAKGRTLLAKTAGFVWTGVRWGSDILLVVDLVASGYAAYVWHADVGSPLIGRIVYEGIFED